MTSKFSIDEIYNNFLKRDFTAQELRSLDKIKKLHKKGIYSFHGSFDKGKILAYGSFISVRKNGPAVLDYFAVEPELRGQGHGGSFLKKLVLNIDIDGLFIECLNPKHVKNSIEKKKKEKIINFHLKNGAEIVEKNLLFGKNKYLILWIPIKKRLSQINTKKEIKIIYRKSVGLIAGSFFKRLKNLNVEDTIIHEQYKKNIANIQIP